MCSPQRVDVPLHLRDGVRGGGGGGLRRELHQEVRTNESAASTHVTQYSPLIGRRCVISFEQQPDTETVEKCYTPLVPDCGGGAGDTAGGGAGADTECRTVQETVCTTRYAEAGVNIPSRISYFYQLCFQKPFQF